ncbi:serpin B4-like [Periplaneta americana]|uniref:serpin B4-like n=1 Tax=Periplaneta americana TaxID=6978 RepID=UPI0037E96C40
MRLGLLSIAVTIIYVSSRTAPTNAIAKSTIDSLNLFSLELFRDLVQLKPSNFALSPIGVSTLVAQLQQGAKNASRTQLEEALHINAGVAKSRIGTLTRKLKFIGKKVDESLLVVPKLDIVHWAFGDKIFNPSSIQVVPEFRFVLQKDFMTEIDRTDFHKPEEAMKQINSWAAGVTHNKMTNLLPKESLLPETQLLLANVVSFKGSWLKFENETKQNGLFSPTSQERRSVPTICWKETLKAEVNLELGAQWVHLPFHGSHFVLVVVLPTTKYGLSNVLCKIKDNDLQKILNPQSLMDVDIEVPEFKISSFYFLEPLLKKLGVEDVFNSKSNLTGINRKGPLKVSHIMHSIHLEIGSTPAVK